MMIISFTKRRPRPYVILDLLSSGVVHLATLDGKPMANWISGFHLNKYHEPLILKILQRIHAAKEHKQHAKKIKHATFDEAKQRTKKLQIYWESNHRHCKQEASHLPMHWKTWRKRQSKTLDPSIHEIIKHYVLVDSSVGWNSLSYETWKTLGKL